MDKNVQNKLTKKQEEFCVVAGVAGAALSITCLLQHFYFMYSLWFTWLMAFVYIFSTVAFILLARKSRFAPICIIITAVLLFIDELLLVLSLTFSVVVVLLMIYSIVMIVLIYMDNLPQKFKAIAAEKEAENNYWKDKL
jgi:predicted membrane protein